MKSCVIQERRSLLFLLRLLFLCIFWCGVSRPITGWILHTYFSAIETWLQIRFYVVQSKKHLHVLKTKSTSTLSYGANLFEVYEKPTARQRALFVAKLFVCVCVRRTVHSTQILAHTRNIVSNITHNEACFKLIFLKNRTFFWSLIEHYFLYRTSYCPRHYFNRKTKQ